ncbi:YbhB/YbcL family Raf kinase inhibitor-like protein [Nocardia sp. BMG111209]|uniref:YbhB/YbcL family Raf kinase inhibitor-like protein n=1 Tax=Nocardia sp. BMG111209 TaxID=1160137 RepID=UPI0003630093|nr:YbhB/YbcL family Raf kinase inhibitor-like protein [Nocardia sp. BMG111209]
MTLLGRILKNRRAGDTHTAWNLPNLHAPGHLTLTSRHFRDGEPIPRAHCAKTIGGEDLSPHLSWTEPPAGTAALLLVVEDIDVPIAKPAVHCLALIDPSHAHLDPGALHARQPATGVRLLRSTIGRGYHGPAPIEGHGPHRYIFQLFALADPGLGHPAPERARPRTLLPAVPAPVLARGRLTGTFER